MDIPSSRFTKWGGLFASFVAGIVVTTLVSSSQDPRRLGEALPTVFDILQNEERFLGYRNSYVPPANGRQHSLEESAANEARVEQSRRRHEAYKVVAARDFARFMGFFLDSGVSPSKIPRMMLNYGYLCEFSSERDGIAIYSCKPNVREGFQQRISSHWSFRVSCVLAANTCESSSTSVTEVFSEEDSYGTWINPYWLYAENIFKRRLIIW
jgi:hypothetical protein